MLRFPEEEQAARYSESLVAKSRKSSPHLLRRRSRQSAARHAYSTLPPRSPPSSSTSRSRSRRRTMAARCGAARRSPFYLAPFCTTAQAQPLLSAQGLHREARRRRRPHVVPAPRKQRGADSTHSRLRRLCSLSENLSARPNMVLTSPQPPPHRRAPTARTAGSSSRAAPAPGGPPTARPSPATSNAGAGR